ncbi:MAG: TRAP transporter large permease [Clostridia bacterium]|nr:TRAP transporter large permease [Clostridia bacterium]
MGLLMSAFLGLMIFGCPIAYCLIVSGTVYFVANGMNLMMLVQRLTEGANTFTLLAVPGFILAGNLMNSGEVTDRIFDFCGKLVGHITGGLGHANILASVIFAGMSGAAIADAGGLGAIELKAMHDAGYDDDFSLAVTGASSLVGPIIPPSIPMVVYGTAASVSIGRLFMAGAVPGLVMAVIMCIMVYIISKRRGYQKEAWCGWRELWRAFRRAFLSLLTVVIILGGILAGVFTPTEAAIVAVFYAVFLGFFYKTLTLKKLISAVKEATETTCTVMLIVCGATVFCYILSFERFPQTVANMFLQYVNNKYLALLIINIFLVFVGMFMDSSPSIILLTPVFLPVVMAYGVDPVHFGIVMVLNLMIGLLTPPVGMVLYVLSKVSSVPFERICKSMVPFIIVFYIVLQFITYLPGITLALPRLLYGG